MPTQAKKAIAFKALHEREGAFIIPNPWDAGSARLLAHLGFEALATTSAGYAFSIGQRDYTLSREQVLKHCAEIVRASDLPVSADLEGGFGDDPETVAETFRMAAATELADWFTDIVRLWSSVYFDWSTSPAHRDAAIFEILSRNAKTIIATPLDFGFRSC